MLNLYDKLIDRNINIPEGSRIENCLMKNKQIFRTFFYIVFVFLITAPFICGCGRQPEDQKKNHADAVVNSTIVKDFEVVMYDKTDQGLAGRIAFSGRWMGWENARCLVFKTPLVKVLTVRDIQVTFYSSEESGKKVRSILKAKKAEIHTSASKDVIDHIVSSKIVCTGDVVLETDTDRKLKCDELTVTALKSNNENYLPQILAKGHCVLHCDNRLKRFDKLKTDALLQIDDYQI